MNFKNINVEIIWIKVDAWKTVDFIFKHSDKIFEGFTVHNLGLPTNKIKNSNFFDTKSFWIAFPKNEDWTKLGSHLGNLLSVPLIISDNHKCYLINVHGQTWRVSDISKFDFCLKLPRDFTPEFLNAFKNEFFLFRDEKIDYVNNEFDLNSLDRTPSNIFPHMNFHAEIDFPFKFRPENVLNSKHFKKEQKIFAENLRKTAMKNSIPHSEKCAEHDDEKKCTVCTVKIKHEEIDHFADCHESYNLKKSEKQKREEEKSLKNIFIKSEK